ncbi:MAG: galactokinase family protein [Oscillospiraceae bacterium]|nr:galactokinase family protein [Oscillospiraceae bacterium]
MEYKTLTERLNGGAADRALARLYGGNVQAARARCAGVIAGFQKAFQYQPEALFSAPGRTEIGGNHTDHQHGQVLAAAVDLDILAAAAPTENGLIRVWSEGYPLITVDLRVLAPQAGEENTSAALIRGVAARMAELGCPLRDAGLDAYLVSSVPGGSGLSSSAAFEVLIGTMLNDLFFGGKCSPVKLAQIGQYAENVFFGKPCGLMDQTASSVGGVVGIDFADPSDPKVEQVSLDLQAYGYALCILNSGAGHADLTGEYAAITDELKAVCRCFGKEFLREVPEEEFLDTLPRVRKASGDRAALRAFHVYTENRRAAGEIKALESGDFELFLKLVRESGRSSALYLQNVVPTGQTKNQELMLTIALCEELLAGRGAVRVHGGGFGGTAQAFVPLDLLDRFRAGAEAVLGQGSCHVVSIRPVGGVRLV